MKKMLGGIKKHGLAGAVSKQGQQWVAPVIEQAQKIDGGAEKHGGLGQAALVYMGVSSSSEEAARLEAVRRQAEEADVRRAIEEAAKREAEEAEARRALEAVAKREAEEAEVRREAQEKAQREAEKLKRAKEILEREESLRKEAQLTASREAEELEIAKKTLEREAEEFRAKQKAELAQEVAKSLKKDLPMKECMFDFAEKFPGDALDDTQAIELMSWLTKTEAPTISEIIGEVWSLHDPVLNEAANQWITYNQPEGITLIGEDS
jgi:flagellar biosynthesis GTPase FlhF